MFACLQYNVWDLNNTRKAGKDVLFFNRVPKVGSQTIMELLKKLSERNRFHFYKDRTQKTETVKLTYYEEVHISDLLIDVLVAKKLCILTFSPSPYFLESTDYLH